MFVDHYPFDYHATDILIDYFLQKKGTHYKKTFLEIVRYEGPRTKEFINFNIINLLLARHACLKDDDGNYIKGVNDLHFGLVDDIRFNAQATKFEDNDLVLINLGLTFRLYEFFTKLLLCVDIFPEIGDLSHATLHSRDMPLFVTTLLGGKDSAGFEYPEGDIGYFITDLAPMCQIRRKYAKLLYVCAIRFLFFHEVGHHRRSHFLIAKKSKYSINDILEIEDRSNFMADPQYLKLLRTLEFDADGYGLTLIIRQFRNDLSAAFDDYSDDVVLTMLARGTVITLRTLESLYPRISDSEHSTHPLPMLRAMPEYVSAALLQFMPIDTRDSLPYKFVEIYRQEYKNIFSLWKEFYFSDTTPIASEDPSEQIISLKAEADRIFATNSTDGIYWSYK